MIFISAVITNTLLYLVTSILPVSSQQAGTFTNEQKPTITLLECTLSDGCTSRQAKLTLDANWRWIHHTEGSTNCYTGNQWNSQYCSDPKQCAQNCAVEGVTLDGYRDTYGIQQIEDGVKVHFVTDHQYGTNVGSRMYVMDEGANEDKYKLFYLKNREFSFDVDVSELQCGMNGAMYFCEMDQDGGKGLGDNNAGAKYGTGYCDAQCPHDIKFISGEANVIDWRPNPKDKSNNMGIGKYGSCCPEMDIWEANSMANAFTPHTCDTNGPFRCDGVECGDNDKGERYDGVCDKDGCDINPYRMGNKQFYGRGPNYAVDTTRPMKVVTQFLTTDGTDDGELYEIRRFYVQDDKIIKSPSSTILDEDDTDTITDDFCDAKKDLFGDVKHFQQLGGMKGMGESLDRGHVMIFSLWDDVEVNMLWLDSAYPLNKPKTDPGIQRGDCKGGEESTPTYLRDNFPNAYVIFRNAAVGEIGSTYGEHLNTEQPSTSPSNTPSTVCVEDPNDEFFFRMDTSVEPNVPIFQTCKWLSNKGNDNFVARVCSRKKSRFEKGPAKDVCFATCDSCPDPSASPSTSPSETCIEHPKDEFFLRMNRKVDPVVPVFKRCSWLSKLKNKKKRNNICRKKASRDGKGPAKVTCPQTCNTCPTSSPSTELSSVPSVVPTENPSPEPSNTQEPSARPVSDEGCCSFNYQTCDQSEFCNESEANCDQCNGLWIYGAPLDCLAKYSACTNDRNGCCSPAKCVGDNNYSQCVD